MGEGEREREFLRLRLLWLPSVRLLFCFSKALCVSRQNLRGIHREPHVCLSCGLLVHGLSLQRTRAQADLDGPAWLVGLSGFHNVFISLSQGLRRSWLRRAGLACWLALDGPTGGF
jgi:hypothetical protein